VAEWNDDAGLQPLNAKYVRLRPHVEFEKNRKSTIFFKLFIKNPLLNFYLHCDSYDLYFYKFQITIRHL